MRWGYCCIALGVPNCTTSHTITVANIRRISERRDRLSRLAGLARENLANTIRLLHYNRAYDIGMYRFSSQLVPLATHEEAEGWDYLEELKEEFAEVGKAVAETNMRVSTHPGQHTVINSPSKSTWNLARKDLEYHHGILQGMGLDNRAVMVVHVGGAYGDREEAARRFIRRFKELPFEIRERIVVENDDRSFSVVDVLRICDTIGRPMVLDAHHHRCFSRGEDLEKMVPEIFATWEKEKPKVHFSSPRSEKDMRSHADDVQPDDFLWFYHLCAGRDFDAMIEAKAKDLALLKLREAVREELEKEKHAICPGHSAAPRA